MLGYYSARFATVEINYTFYRMPTEKTIDGWADTTLRRLRLHPEGVAAHHPQRPSQRLCRHG